jgi:hypothetical protein
MKILLLGLLTFVFSQQSLGQYCMTGGPTSTIDSNLEGLTLIGEASSINYTGCPGVIGIEVYSQETVFLNAGSSYTANVQFGTCGGNFTGAGEAWIDFNNDNIFSPGESIGTWTGLPPAAVSNFGFLVPSGATTGMTKMRVIQGEGMSIPINPCAGFTWGSATDFNVYIQNGVDCSSYIGDDFDSPRPVTAFPFNEVHDNSVCYTNQNFVYNSPDVFYRIIPTVGMTSVVVSLCGSTFDTFLTVLDKDKNVISINDDNPNCGTQSELEVSTIGQDTLYAIVEGWGTNSGAYTINIQQGTLDIESIEKSSFHIYPNPAKNYFTISNYYQGPVTIIDFKGQTVLNQTIKSGETVDIESIEPGMYIVYLKNEHNYKLNKQ